MKFIIGLGNPGQEYVGTRHNVGWMAVEALASELDASFKDTPKFKAQIAEIRLKDDKVLLVLPQTFMNLSGETVQSLLSFYKATPSDLLVVQDEMDFDPGHFAFLAKGGDAGHNGVASIRERLSTDAFARLRIGIGRAKPPMMKEDYVLGRFDKAEGDAMRKITPDLVNAMEDWVHLGLDKAMNWWNGVRSDKS